MTIVKDIMNKGVITVNPSDNLLVAAEKMVKHGIGSLVVILEEKKLGVITEQDFLKFLVNDRRNVVEVKVQEIMTAPAVVGAPTTNIYEASKIMQEKGFRRLPIMENGALVGIVTQTDLNQALREDTIREMRAKLDELERMNKGKSEKAVEIQKLKSVIDEMQESE